MDLRSTRILLVSEPSFFFWTILTIISSHFRSLDWDCRRPDLWTTFKRQNPAPVSSPQWRQMETRIQTPRALAYQFHPHANRAGLSRRITAVQTALASFCNRAGICNKWVYGGNSCHGEVSTLLCLHFVVESFSSSLPVSFMERFKRYMV